MSYPDYAADHPLRGVKQNIRLGHTSIRRLWSGAWIWQAAAILAAAMILVPSSVRAGTFADVPENGWATPFIEALALAIVKPRFRAREKPLGGEPIFISTLPQSLDP